MVDYMHFETNSPKHSAYGFFQPSDGTITINLDEITYDIQEQYFCNTENALIEAIVDVIIHEELHKRFDEANADHDVINEQDEKIFKIITMWVENERKYDPKI